MPLLTHTTPAPKRIALSCEFTKDQKAAEERLGSAKMYEDVDLRGIPLLEFPASLLEQPTGTGVAQFDAGSFRRRGNAAGHARFDGDESDGDSFRRSSEVQENKLGGGGRSSFFRRSSEVREVGR